MPKISRRSIEEALIILGIAGLIMVFQPISSGLYSLGWILLMICTFSYVIFTLIPQDLEGGGLIKKYLKTLIIVFVIVVAFAVLSISLIPVLIR